MGPSRAEKVHFHLLSFCHVSRKMTMVALLSLLAVTGLAVNAAYAQSNTERLVSIDDNAQSVKGIVEGIADDTSVLGTMVSAIQNALSGMADMLTSIMNVVTGAQASVDGIAADVAQMKSKIGGIETTMTSLSGLDDRLADIDGRINSLAVDDGTNDQMLQVLASTVTDTNDRLEQAINQLGAIEAALESIDIEAGGVSTMPAPLPVNALHDGESELNVNTYHYLEYGDATTNRLPNFYELAMYFSCSNDVLIESVELFLAPNNNAPYQYMSRYGDAPTTSDGWRVIKNNFVKVDGRDLYNNKWFVSAGNYAEFHRAAEYNNYPLQVGKTLTFESVLHEGIFVESGGAYASGQASPPVYPGDGNEYLIYNSTRSDNRQPHNENNPLYEISVEWVSHMPDTICAIGFGSGVAAAPGLTKSDMLSYGVATDPADEKKTIKYYSDTIDCGGDPIEITDITAYTRDDWRLADFADVVITKGADEYELTFDADAAYPVLENADDVLPLYVDSEDIVISGKIAVNDLSGK